MMIPVKKKNPTRVFLATEETGTPSCVGDVNWVSSQMVEDGFILYAKIKSNSCKVKYLVEHECNPYEESEIVIE